MHVLFDCWLTHLWIPLVTQWVSSYSALWAQAQALAQALAQAQKVSTGLTRLYRGLYSAVLDFQPNHSFSIFCGSAIDYHWSCSKLESNKVNSMWIWLLVLMMSKPVICTYKFLSQTKPHTISLSANKNTHHILCPLVILVLVNIAVMEL